MTSFARSERRRRPLSPSLPTRTPTRTRTRLSPALRARAARLRAVPSVATTQVLARATGGLYLSGGLLVLVAALPAGHWTGDGLPVMWDRAPKNALAYDLSYGDSPFLAMAAEHGLETMNGLPMLVEQGALALEWWTGEAAPRDVMRAALESGPETPTGTKEQG